MRQIPAELADHYAGRITSLARLVKFRLKNGDLVTFSGADHDIRFDDGGPDGELLYPCLNGMSASAFDYSSSLAVDNAVLSGIVRTAGITNQMIRAGYLSHGRWWMYEVNYLALTAGSRRIVGSGFTGQTTFSDREFRVEARSKTQQLKQPISEAYTLTCPVQYGSPACGKTLEWFDAVVDTVDGTEPDRVFTVTGDVDWPGGQKFKLGVMRVLTGDNAGNEIEVELHDDDEIELLLNLPYALAEGDELQFRIDCNKQARDEVYGCKSPDRWGADWTDHHRGFPDIPVADEEALKFPGGQIRSGSGSGTIPSTAAE